MEEWAGTGRGRERRTVQNFSDCATWGDVVGGKKGRRNGSEPKEDEEVTGIQEYLMRKSEKYRGPSVGEYRVVNSEGGDWNSGLSPLRLNRREEERHGTIQGRVVSFKRV